MHQESHDLTKEDDEHYYDSHECVTHSFIGILRNRLTPQQIRPRGRKGRGTHANRRIWSEGKLCFVRVSLPGSLEYGAAKQRQRTGKDDVQAMSWSTNLPINPPPQPKRKKVRQIYVECLPKLMFKTAGLWRLSTKKYPAAGRTFQIPFGAICSALVQARFAPQ